VFSRFFCLTNFIMIFCFGLYSLHMPHAHCDNDAPTQRTHTQRRKLTTTPQSQSASRSTLFFSSFRFSFCSYYYYYILLTFCRCALHAVSIYTPPHVFLFVIFTRCFVLRFFSLRSLYARVKCKRRFPFVQKCNLRSLSLSLFGCKSVVNE